MKLVPSFFQQNIYDWIASGAGHAIVEAVAGSGKTTTLLEAVKRMDTRRNSVLLCAFNKAIRDEIDRRLRSEGVARTHVKTYHSLGFAIIRRNSDHKVDVYDKKLRNIIKEYFNDPQRMKRQAGLLTKLIGLCKGCLLDGTADDLQYLAARHGLDLTRWSLTDLVIDVREVLRRCMDLDSIIDFDDMVWLPAMRLRSGDWSSVKYDWILSDESQDLNKAQRTILMNSLQPHGRMLCVGDPDQSIYGFRGADPESMNELEAQLEASTLPLSICYRCPTSHIELAQAMVPEIQAREGAPAGVVGDVPFEQAMNMMGDRDLVICRRNAPLVSAAFALIRAGKKAMVKGRDIGKGLVTLIDKLKADDLEDLLDRLVEHEAMEVPKWIRLEKFTKAESIFDQCACVGIIATSCSTITELKAKICNIFSDSVFGTVFSSVHRAKGLEAHRVFILERSRMPMGWQNQQPWQRRQEKNILYVALTRSKAELYMVGDDPGLTMNEIIVAQSSMEATDLPQGEMASMQIEDALLNPDEDWRPEPDDIKREVRSIEKDYGPDRGFDDFVDGLGE